MKLLDSPLKPTTNGKRHENDSCALSSSKNTYSNLSDNDESKLSVNSLNAWFGSKLVLKNINIEFKRNCVTALIGPSGCGKSTLLRCINRMHEVIKGAYATGEVILNGENIYAPDADPVRVRRRIGMVFQKPNPFPTMSIYDNVIAG